MCLLRKRRPPMASISSMKMMQGSCSLAYPNISRISRADSPMYLSTIAEETTARIIQRGFSFEVTQEDIHTLEESLSPNHLLLPLRAMSFPVPGGPYSSTPFGGLIPTLKNSSGFFSGSSMTSRSSRICSFKPPIPPKLTWPGSSRGHIVYQRVNFSSAAFALW